MYFFPSHFFNARRMECGCGDEVEIQLAVSQSRMEKEGESRETKKKRNGVWSKRKQQRPVSLS